MTLAILTLALISCGNEAGEMPAEHPTEDEVAIIKEAPQSKKDSFIKIEFEEGPLKGTHTFTINSQEMLSGMGVSTNDKGFIDINGGTLFNSNGDRLSSFNRLIAEELSQGSNAPYSEDCGGMIFHDRDNTKPKYSKIYVNFTACTPTEITDLTSWKENLPYRQRGIAGNFKDTASLEIKSDADETNTISSPVTISFGLIQKELVN